MPLPDGYQQRGATIRDTRRIRRLEKRIFPKDAYPLIEIFLLLISPVTHNTVILSYGEEELAGFLSVSKPLLDRPVWIITIGVAPEHQHRGLGTFLMQYAEHQFSPGRIRLTVRAGNHPAISLYEKLGYHLLRRQRGYYFDGEDGLIMEKDLSR